MFKLEEEKKNQPGSTMPSGTASSDGGEKESFLEWTERTKANVPVLYHTKGINRAMTNVL